MYQRRKGLAGVLVLALLWILFLPGGAMAVTHWPKSNETKPDFLADQIILKLKGTPRQQRDFLSKQRLTVIRRDERLDYILAKAPKGVRVDELSKKLKLDKGVVYAQPNYIYRTFATTNDPLLGRQWAMKKINAPKAWNISKGKKDVVIAVLDTGIDVNHPDLRGKLVPGTNTVNPLKSIRDDDGHGTHVAGIAAAITDNGIGIAGVAGNCRIMPVKVFDYWGGSDISVSDGIIWAADNGAKVINMSFGTWSGSALLGEAIEYAHQKGVILVAAAGNWASQNISYPAALSQVISVSATDKNDKLARFSSFGPEIDVSAPGEKIFSTYWNQYKGSTYCEMDGTSMAAPQVAGLAALLISTKPDLSNDEVRQIIESSAIDLGEPGWDPQFGHGRIDVFKALTTSFDRVDVENNSPEGAVALGNGERAVQKIDYGFDEDWFSIDVPDMGSLQVELQPAGKVSPALEIYNENGERLEGFNVTEDNFTAPVFDFWGNFNPQTSAKVGETVYGIIGNLKAERYYLKVFGNHNRWSDSHYELTVRVVGQEDIPKDLWEDNNTFNKAREIRLGADVKGTINPSRDTDWFKVRLSPENIYKIDLQVPKGVDLAIEIYDEEEKEAEEGSGSEEVEEGLGEPEYSLESVDYAGQGEDETGTFRVYSKEPGYYYIKVFDPVNGAGFGEYNLKIHNFIPQKDRYEPNDSEKEASAIELGSTVQAGFTDEKDEDWFIFKADKTGIVEVVWNSKGVLKPEISLYDEEMNQVGYQDLWAWNRSSKMQEYKVAKGTYYLSLANSWGAVTGDYSVALKFRDFNFVDQELNDSYDRAVPIRLGQINRGTIYPIDDLDYYVVEVEEKAPVLVRMTPPAGLDTTVAVFKESELGEGTRDDVKDKKRNNDGRQEPLMDFITEINPGSFGQADIGVFMASKPGRYFLMVSGWPEYEGEKIQGNYTLSVSSFNPKPDIWEYNDTREKARAIGNNAIFSPTFMGPEDKDWYKIYVPKGSSLTGKIEVPNDIDGVIELYDTSGKLLVKGDQALTGEEESFNYPIKKSGIYYIKTYDYLGNASVLPYKLTVKYKAIR